MSISLVARRYATALLEIGSETGQLDPIVEDLGRVAAAYESSAELRNAVENPLVHLEQKRAIMADVAQALGLGQMAKNTVAMLVDRRRVKTLPYIARTLRELADAKKGLLRAIVTTATPLDAGYYERLKTQLERMTGKKVAIEQQVDPSIIAGVVTRIGDRTFDGSVRSRLQSMKDALLPQS